jgi:hypothetical protein
MQDQGSQAILDKQFHEGFHTSFSDSAEMVARSTEAESCLYTDQQF